MEELPQSKPNPDPTDATLDAIDKTAKAERDYTDGKFAVVEQRLGGMDVAAKVLNETVTRTPTDIQKEVGHLKGLMLEKFKSIATQFKERDTRSERESRDNKVAVDAAFAAQKEAAAKQDESNQKAIDKSEKVTTDAINKLQDTFKTSNDALQSQINDLKLAQGRIDATKTGATENRTEARDNRASTIAIISVGVMLILAVLTIIGFAIARSKP